MQVAPHVLQKQPSAFKSKIRRAHSSVDLWAVGVTIVIVGQFFSWNAGVQAGSVSFGIAVLLVGAAYTCLACSMAEMSSMLPFAGGIYGLSRCTLGFYAAFILGCCEILEYIMYVASVNVSLGKFIALGYPPLQSYEPLIWFISYGFTFALLSYDGKVFWWFNLLLALYLVGMIAIFCIGTATFASWPDNAGGSEFMFQGGLNQFITVLPCAMWFFAGIEALNTLCNEVDDPKNTIPRGQVAAMATVFVASISVYLVILGLPPGVPAFMNELDIFSPGYSMLFNLRRLPALWLSIPAAYSASPGFLLAGGNIVTALAESKLFPFQLSMRHHKIGTPINALALVALLSFGMCFLMMVHENADNVLYTSSIFFASLAYTSQCVGYVFLKRRYRNMERTFQSPFDVYGPAFSIVVFIICAISIVGFQPDAEATGPAILGLFVVLSLYYHLYAKHNQTFSEDERKILFFAHIAKHNNAKRHRPKRGLWKFFANRTSRASVTTTHTHKTNAAASEKSPHEKDLTGPPP
ncbi:hypothetical protein AeRB84_014246 [Aphanomyces euteiches]|nr:hypothetical protein AeRB84_014246 [Aphanomyces euteiches]